MTATPTQKQHLRETIIRMLKRRLALDPGCNDTVVLAAAKKKLTKMTLNELHNEHQTLSTALLYLEHQREDATIEKEQQE